MKDAKKTILTVAIVFVICNLIDFSNLTFIDVALLTAFAIYVVVEIVQFVEKH